MNDVFLEKILEAGNKIAKLKVYTDTITVVCSERMAELLRNSGIELDHFVKFYDGNIWHIGKKDNMNFYLSKYLPSYMACNFWSEQHPEIKTVLWDDKMES